MPFSSTRSMSVGHEHPAAEAFINAVLPDFFWAGMYTRKRTHAHTLALYTPPRNKHSKTHKGTHTHFLFWAIYCVRCCELYIVYLFSLPR